MKKSEFNWLLNGVAGAGSLASFVEVDKVMSIASAVIAIIAGIVSVAYTIYKWYVRVTHKNSDGGSRITIGEIEEGVGQVFKEVDKHFGKKEDDGNGDG